MSFQQKRNMLSAEEQQILVSLSEISQDIKSHLTLIGELTAQQAKTDTRSFQQVTLVAHEPQLGDA